MSKKLKIMIPSTCREPIIEAERLTKRFGGFVAVKEISFQVAQGETVGILGPNGAGKTTIMRMIACISPITAGELRVCGLDVRAESRSIRANLGVVTQHDGLDRELTVRENLISHGRMFGMRGDDLGLNADKILKVFGLDKRANSYISELSGGLNRRTTLARAFLTEPQVVVLDEPTTSLDPESRLQVWERLFQMQAEGCTILLSTHHMEEASTICDRLLIIDDGQIMAEGSPESLISNHVGSETAVVRPTIGFKDKVLSCLQRSGFSFQDLGSFFVINDVDRQHNLPAIPNALITYRPSNLEDVFFSITGRFLTQNNS